MVHSNTNTKVRPPIDSMACRWLAPAFMLQAPADIKYGNEPASSLMHRFDIHTDRSRHIVSGSILLLLARRITMDILLESSSIHLGT